MTDEPPKTGDDSDLACEEALEPHLIRLIDDDVAVGISRLGAAKQLARAIADPAIDIEKALGVATVRSWAMDAGWKPGEVDKAMHSLAWHLVRAADPGAPD